MPGPEIALPRVPGLYGKLPARGDFVSRRLDSGFIEAWDAWLQRVVAESKQALGAGWLECFLSAPVWRFLVPAGMFGKQGWIGLWLPSVDRVGRYFPLTLAAPIEEESVAAAATLGRAASWLDSLEALALEALQPELDLDVFDRRLAELALSEGTAVAAAASDDTVPLGTPQAAFRVFPPDVLADGSIGGSGALWLTRGGEAFPACIALCGGAMSGEQFCALLDGKWSEHAWSVAITKAETKPEAVCENAPETKPESIAIPITQGVDLIHGQGNSGEAQAPLTAIPSSEHATPMSTGLESNSP